MHRRKSKESFGSTRSSPTSSVDSTRSGSSSSLASSMATLTSVDSTYVCLFTSVDSTYVCLFTNLKLLQCEHTTSHLTGGDVEEWRIQKIEVGENSYICLQCQGFFCHFISGI